MRPRIYGSTDMKRLRTRTWPSEGDGTSVRTREKLSGVGQPFGRDARWISLDVIMEDSRFNLRLHVVHGVHGVHGVQGFMRFRRLNLLNPLNP
jgi:hypothetical protein